MVISHPLLFSNQTQSKVNSYITNTYVSLYSLLPPPKISVHLANIQSQNKSTLRYSSFFFHFLCFQSAIITCRNTFRKGYICNFSTCIGHPNPTYILRGGSMHVGLYRCLNRNPCGKLESEFN